jgi:phosphate uptake regulator
MKRKVIQIADSTQLISLPRKWCQERGIKKGDELEVEEQGTKIQVSTSKEGALEKAQIHFSDASSFLSRPIRTLYKIGYDEVEISFDDPSILELIQESTEDMLGFEIVHHSERTCTIRNVAAAMDTEFENVLRRLMLMLVSTGKDAAEVISKRDFALLDEIIKREKINDKLTLFCERILNKRGYKDHKKLTLMYYVVCQLEHLFDDLNAVCLYTKEHTPKYSPALIKMLRSSAELLECVYNLFYKYDVDQLASFKKKYTLLDKQGETALQNSQKHDVMILHYLLEMLDKLNHLTAYFPYTNN